MSGILPTNTVLDKIVAEKVREVEQVKRSRQPGGKTANKPAAPRGRDFTAALLDKNKPGRPIIAEIKKASPSAGVLRDPFDPVAIARAYAANGARCISVITDEKFFQGSLEVLRTVRAVTDLPLLRKDFIIDEAQIEEAAEAGADAALLIARILDSGRLAELYACAAAYGLAVLLEAHDEKDLEKAFSLSPQPRLLGINNRDLATFEVSTDRTLSLLPKIPGSAAVVSESGLSDSATLDRLRAAGVAAFLIGSSLMKSPDPGLALRRLVYE